MKHALGIDVVQEPIGGRLVGPVPLVTRKQREHVFILAGFSGTIFRSFLPDIEVLDGRELKTAFTPVLFHLVWWQSSSTYQASSQCIFAFLFNIYLLCCSPTIGNYMLKNRANYNLAICLAVHSSTMKLPRVTHNFSSSTEVDTFTQHILNKKKCPSIKFT